jgi:acyl-CoA-binding protein
MEIKTEIFKQNGVAILKVTDEAGNTHWEVWYNGEQINGNFKSEYDATSEYVKLITKIENIVNRNGVAILKVTDEAGNTHWEVWYNGKQINSNFKREDDAKSEYEKIYDEIIANHDPIMGV